MTNAAPGAIAATLTLACTDRRRPIAALIARLGSFQLAEEALQWRAAPRGMTGSARGRWPG